MRDLHTSIHILTDKMSLSTENIQTTVSQLNRDFAGRHDSAEYDMNKLIHIHRRNRAFVWTKAMQGKMLDSILRRFYVPPIICVHQVVEGKERREVMEGGNRITTFRRILTGKVRPLTAEERAIVEAHPITLVVLRNLSSAEQREMFRRLNKSVKVSDGQLYAMSEDDSPLVKEAMAFLNNDDYPLRELITTHFFDTRDNDNDGKVNLANAMALVSGALNGVEYITKSFERQEDLVNSQAPIDRSKVVAVLRSVLDIFTRASTKAPLTHKTKLKGQWSVGHWLGAMLYDVLKSPDDLESVQAKWAKYIVRVRKGKVDDKELCNIEGAKNLTEKSLQLLSLKVDLYLREGRLASKEDLEKYVKAEEAGDLDEEEEEEGETEDEETEDDSEED